MKDTRPQPTVKKNPQEEKEVTGDVEGKSFFKCCYNRKHLDEEYSEKGDEPEEGTFTYAKNRKKKPGCVTCEAQIKDKKYFEEERAPNQ